MPHAFSRSWSMLCMLCLMVSPLTAEELVLRDGKKINGTIVGFEDGMFRVETEFGFALIRKDKVASVNFAAGAKPAAQEHGEQKDTKTAASPVGRAVEKSAPPQPTRAVAALPPPPLSQPVDEPLPANIQGHVEGSNYINDTFHFAMFKPFGWKVYENLPKEAGYGIVAMGTEDERTVLIIDRQVWSGTPDLKNDHVEERLKQTYPEYRKISETSAQLSGFPATRRAFVAVIDGAEWRGATVHFARGNTMFGITGLTSAEAIEFQQAVLNKIINSFHFLDPAPAPATGSAQAGRP